MQELKQVHLPRVIVLDTENGRFRLRFRGFFSRFYSLIFYGAMILPILVNDTFKMIWVQSLNGFVMVSDVEIYYLFIEELFLY